MTLGPLAANPLYHFIAYGITNPTVVWALEHGAYDEWCPDCRGTGITLWRPCGCVEQGDRHCPAERLCSRPDGCPCCRTVCRACSGSRVRADRVMCELDFGDEESLAIALKVAPAAIHDAMRRDTWSKRGGERGSLR